MHPKHVKLLIQKLIYFYLFLIFLGGILNLLTMTYLLFITEKVLRVVYVHFWRLVKIDIQTAKDAVHNISNVSAPTCGFLIYENCNSTKNENRLTLQCPCE